MRALATWNRRRASKKGGLLWEQGSLFFVPLREGQIIHSFSRSLRENEPKEGRYPQGPLQRGMQKENCRNRQFSLGFGKPGHGLSFLSATAMKAKRDLNNLRPCLNTEGCGGEEPLFE